MTAYSRHKQRMTAQAQAQAQMDRAEEGGVPHADAPHAARGQEGALHAPADGAGRAKGLAELKEWEAHVAAKKAYAANGGANGARLEWRCGGAAAAARGLWRGAGARTLAGGEYGRDGEAGERRPLLEWNAQDEEPDEELADERGSQMEVRLK